MKATIRKLFTLQDISLILAIILIGSAFLPFNEGFRALGGVIIASGLFAIPFCRHGYKLSGRDGVFRKESIYVPRECQTEIVAYLRGKNDSLEISPNVYGGAVVNVYSQKNTEVIFAQYFDYALYLEGKEFPLERITLEQLNHLRKIQPQK
ncbi:MAG: hypothetical protein IJT51_02160 [Bacteroidales bacterium]|nr:hypothetical protein [Bacteroidales bacterium]